eukprot:SAG31_NODE_16465_length_677_cov_0.929392_3_plen_23_part_01
MVRVTALFRVAALALCLVGVAAQ